MSRKKQDLVNDQPRELTEREYFELESCAQKLIELDLRKQITSLTKDMCGKNVLILRSQIEKEIEKQKSLAEELQTLEVKRLNVISSKEKVAEAIKDRLQLDSTSFGYDPYTLKIID